MEDPVQTIATNVRRIRREQGKSQEAVALAAGVPIPTIGKIERCEREVGVRTLARVAEALGVELSDLVRES